MVTQVTLAQQRSPLASPTKDVRPSCGSDATTPAPMKSSHHLLERARHYEDQYSTATKKLPRNLHRRHYNFRANCRALFKHSLCRRHLATSNNTGDRSRTDASRTNPHSTSTSASADNSVRLLYRKHATRTNLTHGRRQHGLYIQRSHWSLGERQVHLGPRDKANRAQSNPNIQLQPPNGPLGYDKMDL